jgi:hypothetical protein
MALIKFSAAVSEARGSIGGIVFSRNAGGAYMRTRTTPVHPNSLLQAQAKSLFSAAVNTFTNTLSAGERTAWKSYASVVPYTDVFGATRYYSGQQRYVQAYVAAVNAGKSVLSVATAPTTMTEAENVEMSTVSITQGAAVADGTLTFTNTLAPSDVEAGDLLLLHVGSPVTPAKTYFKGPYRFADVSTFAAGDAYPDVTIVDPYSRDCAAGMFIPCQWRIVKADNRVSPVTRAILLVGAYAGA